MNKDKVSQKVFPVYSLYDPDRGNDAPMNNASVEFTSPAENDGQESQIKNTSVEQKEVGKSDLLEASRGYIEVLTPENTAPPPRETDTSGAREILTEDMRGEQIDLLPENGRGADNPQISSDDKRIFETVFEEGASNEYKSKLAEKSPIDAKIAEIREKIEKTAHLIEEKVRSQEYDDFLGNKLGFAVKDLAERLRGVMQRREVAPEEETESALKELLEESATLGSEEWEKRFIVPGEEITKAETPAQPGEPIAVLEVAREESTIAKRHTPDEPEETATAQESISHDEIPAHGDAGKKEKTVPVAEAEVAVAPNETKEREITPEKERAVSADIEARFQKDFAFAQEDLKSIVTKVETPEGEKTLRFSDLTEGQQLLLLENLKDFAIDNAKEQALKNFTKEEKEKYGNAGFIKKALLSYTKSYRRATGMAEIEKDILEKPELDKGAYTEVLRDMLGAASEAPEAELKDGKLQINFISEKDFQDLPGAKEKVKEYNDTIARFVNVPYEWAYSKNEKEQKQYQEAKESYAKARTELGWLAYEQEEEAGDALSFATSLDKKVQFSQLFSTHPDVEKAFAETKDQKAWWEGVKAIVKEKGTLMTLGRGLSTLGAGVAVSVGSGFAAPVAFALAGGFLGGSASGGILGWLMAGKRARQEIEDKKKLAEIGVLDANNEKEFRKAHEEKEGIEAGIGLADKLGYAVERVLGAETEEEKGPLLKVLADRMHYTEKKMNMDVVSFGEGAEGFRGRYELLSAFAKAQTLFGVSEPETNEKVEKKIDELLGAQEERIETAEEKLKSEKMRQGMKYGIFLGGAFGTLLSSISYTHAHGATDAGTQPITPAPNTDHALLENTLPNNGILSKNTLADDILSKLKFAKNYELPADNTTQNIQNTDSLSAEMTPKTEVSVSQIEAAKTNLEEIYKKLGIDNPKILNEIKNLEETYKNVITDNPLSPAKTEMPLAHQTVPTTINNEGTLIPEAAKVPESVLPEPKMGFSSAQEGTVVPEAVKIPENFFQAPAEHLAPNTAGHEETFTPKDGWMFGPKGTPSTHGIAETLTPRQISIENSFQELGRTYTVKAGDNVWNIIKMKLGGNENFAKLPPREQNFILDSIKDKITELAKTSPEKLRELGIRKDPNLIYPGDKLNLGKVFSSSEELQKIFNRSAGANTAPQHISTPTEIHPVLHTAHKEPIVLAQNEGTMTDIMSPTEHHTVQHTPEIIAPTTGGHFEAFATRIQDIPAYMNYKSLVYNEIHLQHPEIGLPVYDMGMRDFLARTPNGQEALRRIFNMPDVKMPEKLPQETLNGSVLDYWTRQVMQHDLNKGLLAYYANAPLESIH